MLDEKEKLQNKEDIEALREWLRGDKTQPFILARRNTYNITAVLFPTIFSHIKYHMSYFIMAIISKIPWSPVKIIFYRMMGVKIGKGVYIAPWVFLDGMYPQLIELEDGCFLGGGCKLLIHENTTDRFRIGQIRIGANSVIGAFSIVRSGVTIGSNVTTGIGSIVLKDIPDDRSAIGNPARVVKASKKMI
ncbi:MAG: acyltransferase [Planctomycetota bacterium]|jgi:acetyltransferase-like isoleucine patch superfamily enzyme